MKPMKLSVKTGIGTLLAGLVLTVSAQAQTLPETTPDQVDLDGAHLKLADELIEEAIRDEQTPGAAFMVIRNGMVAHREFFGKLSYEDNAPEVDETTIYDLASITKPVATATSAMHLADHGKISLRDAISDFIEDFEANHPEDEDGPTPRIIHLMTHTSGLPAYADVDELEEEFAGPSPDGFINHVCQVQHDGVTGDDFIYSCPGFVTLQRVIENVSGQSLADYAAENIFEPLDMHSTGYQPEETERVAPTEKEGDEYLVGTVHDPIARRLMDGISGNAGLFSNLDDLGRYAAMMLNHGELDGERILSPAAVDKMTRIPKGFETHGRTPGWDMHSPFSTNMGDLSSGSTYGHTGYTGTSMYIDPDNDLAVILLTNRVHPDDNTNVVRLRRHVANVVGASVR